MNPPSSEKAGPEVAWRLTASLSKACFSRPSREEVAVLIPVPLTDQQSKAVEATAKLGQTVIAESGELARYVGRVLGTLPKDVVGLFLGDPFHAVRTVIAAKLDGLVSELLVRRDVRNTEGVSPSIAIPLLKAAYDESRPELQKLWAGLIAAAMDPTRSDRVRLSFINAVRQFDPLDALLLFGRCNAGEGLSRRAGTCHFPARHCSRSPRFGR